MSTEVTASGQAKYDRERACREEAPLKTHLTTCQSHTRLQARSFSYLRLHLRPLLRTSVRRIRDSPKLDIEYRWASIRMRKVFKYDRLYHHHQNRTFSSLPSLLVYLST